MHLDWKELGMMSKRTTRIGSEVILSLVLVLQFVALTGCADKVIHSPFYSQRDPVYQIVIEKPPMRISYTGRITENSRLFTHECIADMSKVPYKNYKFNDHYSVNTWLEGDRKEALQSSHTNSMSVNK